MGAWIEIRKVIILIHISSKVAPFMGAWIEIKDRANQEKDGRVAPFMGAWIEINC